MKHRIFVAIKASREIEENFLRWRGGFSNLPVRWIEPSNLHITLLPPWYEENTQNAARVLRDINDAPSPFEIRFSKISYGPNPKHPRLIWAEGGAPKQMLELKHAIERAFGKNSDPRAARLHITLARFRPQNFSRFTIKRLDENIDWRQNVSSIVLMESKLARSGAEYTILDKIAL